MSAERQSPSAAYVPTQTKDRTVIRSEERTSADLRSRSSGVSEGREPTAAARDTAVLAHSRNLMRRTVGQGHDAHYGPQGTVDTPRPWWPCTPRLQTVPNGDIPSWPRFGLD